mmetsp:Transcript_14504/g.31475  ORF Transcript_14504/g.31475 Transcript_14504/m.31475 type:complete len:966 (+) Transcript_14504:148-3045(+)|eukprot:CAMPEP_0172327632 /NCGR_PEP_ID=MMETSP1058-20130122/59932_1 /TAXON_ID=83371 /ORGANISM="Detonula confervacea, Strain CCMP 353" /LENGTH=965 /DNA_ID=CAMNT_0013044713 /DNA_START=127 /DNA_END=3024 /DNA_ORIENTATION=-
MGNVCCGHDDEDYKRSAWFNPNDADADETENGAASSFNDEDNDAQYNAKATDREHLILLHHKSNTHVSSPERGESKSSNGSGGSGDRRWKQIKKMKLKRMNRQAITSTPMDITSSFSFTSPSFPKSDETTLFLLNALSDNFVFGSIDEDAKRQFVNAMQPHEFNEGDWVMHQGDLGDYFYIVEEGEVAFHVDGESTSNTYSKDLDPEKYPPQVGTGSKGSTFGELALLYNSPRAASVRVLTPLKLYKIDQLTFRSLLMSHQQKDRSNIISLVQKLSVFQDLDEAKVRKLVDAFIIVEYEEGERVVNKGDEGSVFYIVKSGQLKVDDIGHGSSKFQDQILEEGDCFGERALITGDTRAANVTAIVMSSLLAISKEVLEEILGSLEQAIMDSSYSKYLRSIPLFEYLEPDEIDRCVKYLKEESFEKGDKILAKGKLYLIQDGRVLRMLQDEDKNSEHQKENGGIPKKKATPAGHTLVKLEKGDYFGDLWGSDEENDKPQSPAADKMNENTITVEANMKCLTLLASDIQSVIGDLNRVLDGPALSNLDRPASEEQEDNDRSKKSRISKLMNMLSQTSSFDTIKRKKSTTNRNVMNLSKLKKHRILGMGTFGKVWLVTPKSNSKDKPTPFALKMVSKRQLLQQRLAAAAMREKNVMESVVHPFLLHMVSSFQDENYLYFVMDLILGGELFELIYSNGKKMGSGGGGKKEWKASAFYESFGPEDDKQALKSHRLAGLGIRDAVFYGACVIDGFAHLHNRRIAYRDLKPENVMLNANGYCVVVDMGFAKVVLDKTYTMCGTPEYLAPELIVNKGHNHAADYWSFACLLYELVVGQTPFFEEGIDQFSLLKRIVKAQYEFPEKVGKLSTDSSDGLDKALCHWKDLISRLLKNKSVERIGNLRNGVEDILDHDLFANIDFNELRNQSIPAPWVPNIVDPLDTSHFGNDFGRQDKPERFKRQLSEKDQSVFMGF